MDEKRRHKRYTIEGVHGNMLFATEVNILNISIGGAAIEADKRLNIDSEYTLKLQEDGTAITLKGIVIWSVISKSKTNRNGETVPMYQAGLRFTNVMSDKSMELLEFLERHGVAGETRLSGIRFVIDSAHTAMLDYPFNYKIKTISLGGMLIESDLEFTLEERFSMEIYLEEDVPVEFQGRVASCSQIEDSDPTLYDVGIEFMDMSEESRASLEGFIDTL
jgi:c-di-GMP-binding flagellar brake protein YcgR